MMPTWLSFCIYHKRLDVRNIAIYNVNIINLFVRATSDTSWQGMYQIVKTWKIPSLCSTSNYKTLNPTHNGQDINLTQWKDDMMTTT